VLEGLSRADVGLRRSRLDRDANAGSGEINAAVHHLALLDEIVDHVGIVHDQIRWRAGIDLLHQRRTRLEPDNHRVPGDALESGRNVSHPRHHAHAGQDGDQYVTAPSAWISGLGISGTTGRRAGQ
jgi:hypothetical protein